MLFTEIFKLITQELQKSPIKNVVTCIATMLAGGEGPHRAGLPRGSASSDVVTGQGVRSRVASKLIDLVKKQY